MTYDLSNYADVQKIINDRSYAKRKYLIVKKMGNLFVIKYNKKELTNINCLTLGSFRSVICDNKGNVLSMAPPKSVDFDIFSQTVPYDNCIFQDFVEGTMINVFWDLTSNDWNIATRSNIGARCKFNQDCELTFRHMFLDAMNEIGLEFKHLCKEICYSFVLQHPKNRIVIPIMKPNLYLARCYDCSGNIVEEWPMPPLSGEEKPKYETIQQQERIGESWQDLIEHFSSDNLDYTNQGIVIIDKKTGWRTKFRSKNYEKVKHLKGNSPKMQYHYYHLRQQGLVKSFLQYYPEYKKLFFDMRANLHDWSNQLYKNYRECFIHKQKYLKNYPYNFKTHMYALHELYLYDLKSVGQYINKNEIIKYVNNLPPPRLMYAVNYNLRKYGQREAVVNQLT